MSLDNAVTTIYAVRQCCSFCVDDTRAPLTKLLGFIDDSVQCPIYMHFLSLIVSLNIYAGFYASNLRDKLLNYC